MTRLAIDLGTSHTVAVVERPGQQPRPVLFDGSPVLPSGVFAATDGRIHVGRDAERLAQLEPHRYEPHPKRRVDEGTVLLGDSGYPVATLLGALLNRVVQEAGHASTTVITCPADWGRVRRSVLIDAARQAGIADPVLVDEPVAAAAYCTRVLGGQAADGQSLLVFDFGGGTLDLALVRLDPGGTRVTGVSGLENLGGLDVDEALVGHLGQIVAARDPATWQRLSRPADAAQLRDRRAFRAEVRVAKEMLSRTTIAPVNVPGWTDTLHLTREELDRLAGPLIDRAVDETRRLLDRAGHPIGAILLVGGSSRIPLVATRLHGRFGIAPMVPEQPELPVALGALASVDDAPGSARPVSGGPQPPAPARPVSGGVGFGGAYTTGGVGGPGSPGDLGGPGGDHTTTGVPVSGGPFWTGQQPTPQPGQPWATDQPSWPPVSATRQPRRARGGRTATLIAIAASVTVIVLAGAAIWFVRDGLRERGEAEKPAAQPTTSAGATSAAPSPSPSISRGPTPKDFAWCGEKIFCPTKPYCEDADDEEVDCAKPHRTEVFAGGYLPSDAAVSGSDAIADRIEVKVGCSAGTLKERTLDHSKTSDWNRYSQWQNRNGQSMFLCFTGPEEGTTTGSIIKQAPPQ